MLLARVPTARRALKSEFQLMFISHVSVGNVLQYVITSLLVPHFLWELSHKLICFDQLPVISLKSIAYQKICIKLIHSYHISDDVKSNMHSTHAT